MTLFLGDTVIFKAGVATVIIEANDDPNGIFSLEPLEKPVEEGKSNNFLWVNLNQCFYTFFELMYMALYG